MIAPKTAGRTGALLAVMAILGGGPLATAEANGLRAAGEAGKSRPVAWRAVPIEPAPKSRRDKLRSREAILAAARELFGSGRDVPMYEIGQRAGVGHATLYRHFSDRAEIVATLCRELVEQIESVSELHGRSPGGLWRVLSATVDALVLNHDFLEVLRGGDDEQLLTELRARTRQALAEPLKQARAAALVRADLTLSDLVMVLAMTNSALDGVTTMEQRTVVGHRALALLRGGLEPR